MTNLLRCELHCHSIYSRDSLVALEKLLAACERKGLQRLAITDHNTIAGARRARELDPERVIIGEEIMTAQGELLAFFVQESIPPGLSPQETIRLLRQQGAFISVSHPFDRLRKGAWEEADLLEIAPLVDAIEVFNARCISQSENRAAADFARQHHLPGTVGSDAHTLLELGSATLLLPEFRDADELRQVIRQGRAEASLSPFWVHFTSRYALWYKKLKGIH
ncbi:MAG: PHP domain-containing protein [Anaerolineales bacterium]|nr:PHP domain-containing protein [Anaerolineales bacterium]